MDVWRQMAELRAIVSTAREPVVARLLPLAIYSNWFYTYQFSCFNHELFTVRSQVRASALSRAPRLSVSRGLDARVLHRCPTLSSKTGPICPGFEQRSLLVRPDGRSRGSGPVSGCWRPCLYL